MSNSEQSRAVSGMPRLIIVWTSLHVSVCLALWTAALLSGSFALYDMYVATIGVLFLLSLSACELVLAMRAVPFFEPKEPLFWTWRIIVIASECRLAGLFLAHIVGPWHSRTREIGFLISGPLQLLLLGLALVIVLKLYIRLGFELKPRLPDYVAVGAVAAYTGFVSAMVVAQVVVGQKPIQFPQSVEWFTDPLLSLILLEAVLLRRAAVRMGGGLISRCWTSYTIAVMLTVAGNALVWFGNSGLLTGPALSLSWLIWYPAAGAYASAPAWQLEAIRFAVERGDSAVPGSLQLK